MTSYSITQDINTEQKPLKFTNEYDYIDFHSKYKIYVFDLDGTLVNTLRSLQISSNLLLKELSLASVDDIDIFKYFVGNGTRLMLERAYYHVSGKKIDLETREKYHERFRTIYQEHCLDEVSLYPGIKETLLGLKARGALLACYTNKDDLLAKKCLETLFAPNCHEIFSEIRGHIDGKEYKPNAYFIEELITKYSDSVGLADDRSKIIMVGDSDVDIRTAQNASISSCACCWGFRAEDELSGLSPNHLIREAKELLFI